MARSTSSRMAWSYERHAGTSREEPAPVSDDVHYQRASAIIELERLEVPEDMRHNALRKLGWDEGQRFIDDTLLIARSMLMALGDHFVREDTIGIVCYAAASVATDHYHARVRGLDE